MKDKTMQYAAFALFVFLLALSGANVEAGSVPQQDDDRFLVVKAKKIITISGEEINNGVIVIKNGCIEAVGKNVDYPHQAEIIDAADKVVMPGLINPCTSLGVKSYRRSGVLCNLKAADEFVLDKKLYDKLMSYGFTTFGVLPTGSAFPGQALALNPGGANEEEWTLNDSAFIYITMTNPSREKTGFEKAFVAAKKEIAKAEKALKDWEEKQKKAAAEKKKAEDAAKKKAVVKKEEKGGTADTPPKGKTPKSEEKKEPKFTPPPMNPAYKPLVDLIQKKENVQALIALRLASDYGHIKHSEKCFDIDINRSFRIFNSSSYLMRTPETDFYIVVDELGKAKVKVAVNAIINYRTSTNNRFNLPADLAAAGCEITLLPPADSTVEHADFLKRVAALIKGGLKRDDALKAITLNPAKLLGLEKRIGSLEKGKDANILILTGDPFNATTKVDKVLIKGKVTADGRSIQ